MEAFRGSKFSGDISAQCFVLLAAGLTDE